MDEQRWDSDNFRRRRKGVVHLGWQAFFSLVHGMDLLRLVIKQEWLSQRRRTARQVINSNVRHYFDWTEERAFGSVIKVRQNYCVLVRLRSPRSFTSRSRLGPLTIACGVWTSTTALLQTQNIPVSSVAPRISKLYSRLETMPSSGSAKDSRNQSWR